MNFACGILGVALVLIGPACMGADGGEHRHGKGKYCFEARGHCQCESGLTALPDFLSDQYQRAERRERRLPSPSAISCHPDVKLFSGTKARMPPHHFRGHPRNEIALAQKIIGDP